MQISVSNDELLVKLCAIEGILKEFWKYIIRTNTAISNKEEQCEVINKYFAEVSEWTKLAEKRISN